MKKNSNRQGFAALLTIFAAALWVAFSFAGASRAEANFADCPRGPLRAELAGSSTTGGKAPSGTAQFRERGTNGLMVMVRGIDASAGTSLNVMIAGTSVGTISVPKNGNGQLKVDTAPEITEGTAVTVMNGETTVLAGQFQCVAGNGGGGGGSTMTPTPTGTATPSPTMTMTPTPTASPTPTDSPSPTPTPTIAPR